MPPKRDWITAAECVALAAQMGKPISEWTIHQWGHEGKIQMEQPSPKTTLFYRPSIEQYLKGEAKDKLGATLYRRLSDANDAGAILADDEKLVPDLLRWFRAKFGRLS